jgi:transposase
LALWAPERLALRQKKSLPLMMELRERVEILNRMPLLAWMRKGVGYFRNQWEKLLIPFAEDGRLELDNGEAERRLRRVASGRKSWLFAGSERGAKRFAGMLSLVSSAEAAGLEPGKYLTEIFARIGGKRLIENQVIDLLPHRWLNTQQFMK